MNTYTGHSADIYQRVTDIIISQLEHGTIAWRKGWAGGVAPLNLISGKEYKGFNVWLLSSMGYTSPYWLTFNQCRSKGGQVKAGEKSTPITFWDITQYKTGEKDINGKDILRSSILLRYYNVFNVQQTTLIAGKHYKDMKRIDFKPIEQAEKLITGYRNALPIKHELQRAFYSPIDDYINMPQKNSFTNEEEYYSTLYHELTHSTGHKSRLNRDTVTQLHTFGSHEYSKEELVAEMGAGFLSAMAGIEQKTLTNSAAYIQGWLKALKNDKKLLISAGGRAQKAVEYITNYKSLNI